MSKHATCEEGQRSHWEGSLPSISWVMGKEVEGLEVRLRITGKEEKEEELGEGETEDASLSLSGEREFGRGELDEELVQQVRSHGLYHIAKGYIYQCAVGGIIDVSLQDAIAKMQVEKQRDEAVGPMLSQVTNDEKLQLSDALQSYISVLGAMHQDISAYQDRINEVRTSALENWDSDKNSGSQGPMVRLRGRIPKKAREILTKWAMSHQDDPYPSKDEKKRLTEESGLTHDQVSNWFINARRRLLKRPSDGDQPQWKRRRKQNEDTNKIKHNNSE